MVDSSLLSLLIESSRRRAWWSAGKGSKGSRWGGEGARIVAFEVEGLRWQFMLDAGLPCIEELVARLLSRRPRRDAVRGSKNCRVESYICLSLSCLYS